MAVKILSIELEICPSTEAYRYRAQAEGMMGNLDGAEADLTAAIKLAPQGELFFQRGHLYLRRHDYDKAVQDFTQAIKLDGLPPGYHARAMAYFAKDDYAGAAEDLAQFFKLNTDKEFSASIARSRVCKGLHKHGFDVEGCEKPARGEGRQ